ncbi:MAG: hypothetical protein P3C10_06005 [Gemmatimonadota bacterium]|nr:hypothetical protein [Gemmatimonadota bacterium]
MLLTAACTSAAATSSALPPDAYGTFLDNNDPIFRRVLLVESDGVALTTSLTANGRAAGTSSTCRATDIAELTPEMALTLRCDSESIPYTFQFRSDRMDWVVVEDGTAPMVFVRR